MRLFVAVLPPAAAVDHLRGAVERLNVVRADAGVVRPDRWHLTLAFLGEVGDPEDVRGRLTDLVAAGRSATVSLAGSGRFGERVLWAGVGGDVDGLSRTASAVRLLAPEPMPFRAHLTLARPRGRVTRDELRADVAALRDYAGPSWPADEIHLMRSIAGTYEPQASWRLRPAQA
ncbi:RNA 2',3'-cyclic phosphodiesterase [Cryptosporangium sp. NPDC048952]|uniref:RNA 2',3'-cyclic phosphodiesterase n=1 Tax=Cryptosporangium sp. NPDC048952 TaxID=3363961 RepID=UPI00371FA027